MDTATNNATWRRDSQPFCSRANSLPGANRPIGPWPIRSLELSLPGPFAPWPSLSLKLSFPRAKCPGTFTPWNFRTQEYLLQGTFALWNFRSLLVRDIICDIPLYSSDMYLWHSYVVPLCVKGLRQTNVYVLRRPITYFFSIINCHFVISVFVFI